MRWLYLRTTVAFLQSCEEAIALGHLDIPDYFPRREGGLPLHYDASFKMSLRNFWSTFLLPGKEAQIWNGKQIFAPFHLTGHLTLCSCVHCQNWKCFHENIYFSFQATHKLFFLECWPLKSHNPWVNHTHFVNGANSVSALRAPNFGDT